MGLCGNLAIFICNQISYLKIVNSDLEGNGHLALGTDRLVRPKGGGGWGLSISFWWGGGTILKRAPFGRVIFTSKTSKKHMTQNWQSTRFYNLIQ